jgi:nucleotide-binding universal stress UspA family protein
VEGERPAVNIDSVILATDFLNGSENPARYAHLLAHYFSAKMIVTHAFLSSQAAMEAEALTNKLSRERQEIFNRLSRIAKTLNSGGGDARAVVLEGNTEQAVATLAEQYSPALIVLGAHGSTRTQREFIGSTAEKILRSTPWPCLVVGPHVTMATTHSVPFRRILYATDFSPTAAHAAIYAVALAEQAGAAIHILNVVPKSTMGHPDHLTELQNHFHRELDRVVPAQARDFCDPRTFVETGDAHKRIKEHIRQHEVDLLVIGMRKSSHLEVVIRTSPAFQLVIDSPCPVLTIRG